MNYKYNGKFSIFSYNRYKKTKQEAKIMIQEPQTDKHQIGALTGASKRDNYYELHFETGEIARFYILADGIFRLLLDPKQQFNEENSAFIQFEHFNNNAFEKSRVRATNDSLIVHSGNYQIIFWQKPAIMSIFDETLHGTRMAQSSPIEVGAQQTTEFLDQDKNEFYFGGGLQNGYFSHKGRKIKIKRDHITGKGGVISEVPFFWSNRGYGELRNTTQAGTYDFGKTDSKITTISHKDQLFDNFYLLGSTPQEILSKFYRLTGKPAMLPKYALGLGHIGNFCTTMWQPSKAAVRNATKIDGDFYTRTKNEELASHKASLNGEENYHFSARAMIDRYQKAHFKLSWFVPNYNVTAANDALAFFNDYAVNQEVAPGFWHQDNLALPEKTAFAFTSDAGLIDSDKARLQNQLQDKRAIVFSDSGSVGTQKDAALIYGDVGGNWENIATQVAGLVGSNLSGQPLAGAAVDGTVGGGNAQITVRDFEWKAFTPLLFNLDDQGQYSKTPFAYNRKITDINHAYLQLHQRLQSYLYTLSAQARLGKPIVRPLFIDFPEERTNYTEMFSSEFMLGDNLLIAPITNGRENEQGDSLKDNLYLPGKQTMWIDLFTGQKYAGGRVYNNLLYPTWHLPVFVRGGSIFNFGKRDYVIYPQGTSHGVTYDDNGTVDFESNHSQTRITSSFDEEKLVVTVEPTEGQYPGLESDQPTALTLMCDAYPENVEVRVNDQIVPLQVYGTLDAFDHASEGIFYNTNYSLSEFSQYHLPKQTALQIKLANHPVTTTKIEVTIRDFSYSSEVLGHEITSGVLPSPKLPSVASSKISAHSFELAWTHPAKVQVEINNLLYEGIEGTSFTFHELLPNTRYIIRMRYVIGNKVSEWSDLFGVITKHAAEDYAIQEISVTSNFTSKANHPLDYLTDLKLASEWQTSEPVSPEHPLELTFKFSDVEKLSRMAFVPRNIDHEGDPTEISLAVSTDNENYHVYADHVTWKADSKNKVIGLRDVRAKSVRLTVYRSSGPMVAAREIIFYRAKR